METKVWLTTFDNPFDPFEDFTSWFMFDVSKGYYTCNYLARIANFAEGFSLKEEDEEIERAIDEIIEINPLNIYKKIKKEVKIVEFMEE